MKPTPTKEKIKNKLTNHHELGDLNSEDDVTWSNCVLQMRCAVVREMSVRVCVCACVCVCVVRALCICVWWCVGRAQLATEYDGVLNTMK